MTGDFEIKFVPSGRGLAQCRPDPNFPDGREMQAGGGGPSCTITFPYPAPECGWFRVQCRRCFFRIVVSAAGRVDDPKSLTIPCVVKTGFN